MDCGMNAAVFFALGFCASIVSRHIRAEWKRRKRGKWLWQEQENFQQMEELGIQTMERIREETEKVRHDFNNQLAAAYRLIEQRENGLARDLLEGMRDEMTKSREYEYCGNGIVNAVLIEKAKECKRAGIRMQLDLKIWEEPGIKPMHLCSVFSNLLDNAIQAVAEAKEEERHVTVRAFRKGDYLYVKVENPLVPRVSQTGRKKGYGQEILREIAELYEGEFWNKQKDGMYMACISLLVERKGKG